MFASMILTHCKAHGPPTAACHGLVDSRCRQTELSRAMGFGCLLGWCRARGR